MPQAWWMVRSLVMVLRAEPRQDIVKYILTAGGAYWTGRIVALTTSRAVATHWFVSICISLLGHNDDTTPQSAALAERDFSSGVDGDLGFTVRPDLPNPTSMPAMERVSMARCVGSGDPAPHTRSYNSMAVSSSLRRATETMDGGEVWDVVRDFSYHGCNDRASLAVMAVLRSFVRRGQLCFGNIGLSCVSRG